MEPFIARVCRRLMYVTQEDQGQGLKEKHTFLPASVQHWHLDPCDLPYQKRSGEEMSGDLLYEATFR